MYFEHCKRRYGELGNDEELVSNPIARYQSCLRLDLEVVRLPAVAQSMLVSTFGFYDNLLYGLVSIIGFMMSARKAEPLRFRLDAVRLTAWLETVAPLIYFADVRLTANRCSMVKLINYTKTTLCGW